ncbi:hypothetical protein ES708_21356 [subsurface metagenome]
MLELCPLMKSDCNSCCRLGLDGRCLVAEFLKSQIEAMALSTKMVQQFMPALRRLYDLPEEAKGQLPEDLRQQIDDIFKKLEG